MFITLLVVTFLIACLVSFITARIFRAPIRKILDRVIEADISHVWAQYLSFAIYVVGISGGVRIWDLETDEERNLDPGHGTFIQSLAFTPDGRLIESSLDSLAIWDLATDTRRKLFAGPVWDGQPGPPEGGSVVFLEGTTHFQGIPRHIAIDSGEALPIADWGIVGGLKVTQKGELVAGTPAGTLKVGTLAGGRPHLLFGHEGFVFSITEGPDWIVSGGNEGGKGSVRIWPKPDVSKTPFHRLPYEEILAKLRALTNVRVVRDENSETGYATEIGEFPGWQEVPSW